jgi:hypothetical protein
MADALRRDERVGTTPPKRSVSLTMPSARASSMPTRVSVGTK